ncbi:nuclease domain-containing protein [Paenibacillus sp. N3.4]|uniref:nuclease domain-containing protein n=1 Tax=Paenibacillus sp. N3.4 TaxID=2603222 RepID=UPI001C9BC425|nr:nuclease domain-containing protein [Paenibacillus sp. N3.4]
MKRETEKVDIDKMHAYRDSIRDGMNNPVIQYVAILYPGKTVNYTAGLTAVRAYPNEDEKLGMTLIEVLKMEINRCISSGISQG